jgi:hypothetical protein
MEFASGDQDRCTMLPVFEVKKEMSPNEKRGSYAASRNS